MPRLLLRLEGLALFVLATLAFAYTGLSWWLYALLFLSPDLSFAAYKAGPRPGASSTTLSTPPSGLRSWPDWDCCNRALSAARSRRDLGGAYRVRPHAGLRLEIRVRLPRHPSRPHRPASSRRLMLAYIARRVLLMIPTILGIMLISFVLVQFAPGGPVERIIAQLQGQDSGATSRISGGGGDFGGQSPGAAGAGAGDASSSAIAARRASTRNSSSSSKRSSASTSRPMSVS